MYSLPQIKKFGKYYSNTSDPKRCLAFSRDPSGTVVAAGDECGRVFVWDAVGRMVRTVEQRHTVSICQVAVKLSKTERVMNEAGKGKDNCFIPVPRGADFQHSHY